MTPTFPPWFDRWLDGFARAVQLFIDGLAAACRAILREPKGSLAAQIQAALARCERRDRHRVPRHHDASRHAVRPRAADFKRPPQRLPCNGRRFAGVCS
ncbi:MAG: hypothetical protein EKK55_01790 [Rhodocyclaceae bacterium]|nr:MAG: hypothetical protein EKK55_01790 [Rhodocyclaceae bacterium]